jgi:hypothetical protein
MNLQLLAANLGWITIVMHAGISRDHAFKNKARLIHNEEVATIDHLARGTK